MAKLLSTMNEVATRALNRGVQRHRQFQIKDNSACGAFSGNEAWHENAWRQRDEHATTGCPVNDRDL
jgi:hypothetical protein